MTSKKTTTPISVTKAIDPDEWTPLLYEKVVRSPMAATKRITVEYFPEARSQAAGLDDWITTKLAEVHFNGNYVHEAVAIHHCDGSATIWRRSNAPKH